MVKQCGGWEGGTEEEGPKEGEGEELGLGRPGGKEGAEEEGGEGVREGGERLEDYGFGSFEHGDVVGGEEGLAFLPFLGSRSCGECFELGDDCADGLLQNSRGIDG